MEIQENKSIGISKDARGVIERTSLTGVPIQSKKHPKQEFSIPIAIRIEPPRIVAFIKGKFRSSIFYRGSNREKKHYKGVTYRNNQRARSAMIKIVLRNRKPNRQCHQLRLQFPVRKRQEVHQLSLFHFFGSS